MLLRVFKGFPLKYELCKIESHIFKIIVIGSAHENRPGRKSIWGGKKNRGKRKKEKNTTEPENKTKTMVS